MRIPDEKKMFNVGDKVLYKSKVVTVHDIQEQTVYYEHRPIATYLSYIYVVIDDDNNRHYTEASDLLIYEKSL